MSTDLSEPDRRTNCGNAPASGCAEHLPAGWMEAIDAGDTAKRRRAARRSSTTTTWCTEFGESGFATPTWPAEYGAGLSLTPGSGAAGQRGAQPVPRAAAVEHHRHRDGRAHGHRVGERGASSSSSCAASRPTRRSGASSSASRARAPTSPGWRRARSATATSGSSTARRSGRRWRTSPATACCSPAPTPTSRSTGASATSWSTCTQPGVEVRPLRQITGDAEFNEVFFENARVPDAWRLGPVGEGWRVAITTLMNERVSLSGPGSVSGDTIGGSPVAAGHRPPPAGRPTPASASGWRAAWIDHRIIGLNNQRAADRRRTRRGGRARGLDHQAAAGGVQPAAPEARGRPRGRRRRRVGGRGPHRRSRRCSFVRRHCRRPAHASRAGFLRAQANTIEGGTSAIMRNILGERVLGLPEGARRVA